MESNSLSGLLQVDILCWCCLLVSVCGLTANEAYGCGVTTTYH